MNIPQLSEIEIGYFFKQVTKTDTCWLWTDAIWKTRIGSKPRRYGFFSIRGTPYNAHVVSYVIHNGHPIGDDAKLYVLHKCDNKRCVNPEHLYLGSHSQNMIDWQSRAENTNSRFDDKQLLEIRTLLQNGENAAAIADKYDVYPSTINNIKLGTRYRGRGEFPDENTPRTTPLYSKRRNKLTVEQAIEIKTLANKSRGQLKDHVNFLTYADIGKRFNVSIMAVCDIVKGRTFSHI